MTLPRPYGWSWLWLWVQSTWCPGVSLYWWPRNIRDPVNKRRTDAVNIQLQFHKLDLKNRRQVIITIMHATTNFITSNCRRKYDEMMNMYLLHKQFMNNICNYTFQIKFDFTQLSGIINTDWILIIRSSGIYTQLFSISFINPFDWQIWNCTAIKTCNALNGKKNMEINQ